MHKEIYADRNQELYKKVRGISDQSLRDIQTSLSKKYGDAMTDLKNMEIGRASCRERV